MTEPVPFQKAPEGADVVREFCKLRNYQQGILITVDFRRRHLGVDGFNISGRDAVELFESILRGMREGTIGITSKIER
jgi:hypothetical protein